MKRKILILLCLYLLFPLVTLASTGDVGGLPWEGPLDKIVKSITGPVAFAISLLGIVSAGCGLVFGGELSEFVKVLLKLILVVSLIVGAGSILSILFGVSGALING